MIPEISYASSSLISSGPDESKLGDVLLFSSPESTCQNTRVVSAFTHTTYYTITTDASGFKTQIYRGNAKGNIFGEMFNHIATISTASGHRVWESTERDEREGKRRKFGDSEDAEEKVDYNEKSKEDEDECDDSEEEAYEKPERNKETPGALRKGAQNLNDVFMIEYGKGASRALRESVSLENGSVTISVGSTKYSWKLEEGHPALYAVDLESPQPRQVIWTRPPHISATQATMTTFPATLSFYPETRPILDAVIIALVIWEMKVKSQLGGNGRGGNWSLGFKR